MWSKLNLSIADFPLILAAVSKMRSVTHYTAPHLPSKISATTERRISVSISLLFLVQSWEQEPEYGRNQLFVGPWKKRHATLSTYQNLWWKWPIKPLCSSHCHRSGFFLSVDLLMLCQKAETQLWHKKLLFTVDGKLTLDWATWTPSPNINRIYQHCLSH